ncbi:tetratricopeptide repeat protein [Ruficoccus amylovorans]|uniref:Tetratricopeptide repeat protein n=1 Tax=Ruficoccus amylovorans TaxID=1804625 RepID=A0A842H9M8_9BACT|nr:tetratricopeptide repeat protein [Ruficoccus amylovorans]MBC2593122.1 tetratricopeptide repeat protein [Ruficoccus amylovorans]
MDTTESTYQEIELKDLDPRLRKQVENAQKSISRNASYAIDICTNILQREPGCLDVRKILRTAQKRATAGKTSGFSRLLGSVTSAPFAIKASTQLKKDPKAAMESAEKMLSNDPANASAQRMLGQAAEALGLWETAAFAYEEAKAADPKSLEIKLALGNALIEAGRAQDAVHVAGEVLADLPGNDQAQELVKRASVAESMKRGKWEEEGGFRDKLANEEEAIELEQQARVVNDEETVQKLVSRNLKLLEKEPDNMNLYRDIINGYRNLEDYDKALEYLKMARERPTGRGDTTLERLASDLTVQSMRKRIAGVEEQLAAKPDDASLQQQIESLRKEEHDFRLKNARETVEKYPNDYAARFDLGQLLYEDGQFDEAIQQFQQARRNPKVRTRAILYLGRALNATGKSDMAIEQLKAAKGDVIGMSDLKKEIIYDLAIAYTEHGDEDSSIEELKEIYQDDIGYKDVSDRINAYYEKKKKNQ